MRKAADNATNIKNRAVIKKKTIRYMSISHSIAIIKKQDDLISGHKLLGTQMPNY